MALGFVTGCSLPSASPPERARSGLSGILHLLLASLERRGQSESWKRAAACQRDTSLGEQPCRVVPVIVSVVFVGWVSLHQAFLPPGPPPPPQFPPLCPSPVLAAVPAQLRLDLIQLSITASGARASIS